MSTIDELRTVELRLGYDEDCEDPRDLDGAWKIYTGRELTDRMTDRGGSREYKWLPDSLELFWKLRNGLAFTLEGWVDAGSSGTKLWLSKPYDPTEKIVGLMVFEEPAENMGAKTYDERAKDAKDALDEFNRWVSGDCYWYSTSGYAGDFGDGDSCGGFIGHDYFCETVKEALEYAKEKVGPFVVVLADDQTEGIFSEEMLPEGIEVRTRKQQRQMDADFEAVARDERDELADSERLEMAS